jgi:hypothetical protein
MSDFTINVADWVWEALANEDPEAQLDGIGPTAARVLFASISNGLSRPLRVGDSLELADEWFIVDHIADDYVVLRSLESAGLWIHDEFSEPLEGRLRWPWQDTDTN